MRRERDTLGEVDVPADALWGGQTQRALLNYPISRPRRMTDASLTSPGGRDHTYPSGGEGGSSHG